MSCFKRSTSLILASMVLATLGGQPARAESPAALTPAEAREIAVDAYVFGYPLVTMEYTRRVVTNIARPEGTKAPVNQVANLRSYPDAAFRDVTAPNADTLYSSAFLDLSKEPIILSLPDMADRFFLMPLLSGWTDVFQVPGKRTTGTGAQAYALTGPGWKGTLPKGVTRYESPTNMVWLLGRTYCDGTPEDYARVHELQDQYKLTPLSSYGKPYTAPAGKVDPSVDMKTPVRDQVNGLSSEQYFDLLADLMVANPPARADGPMVARIARLGIKPGLDFDPGSLDPDVADAIKDVPDIANKKILAHFKDAGKDINGWLFTTDTGIYGTDYLQRALITAIGLGANRPQDAVYPTSEVGADGQPYVGANKYVVHFDKGQLPPAKGFWSLTMYDEQMFFVENPLNRYSISARQNLKSNPDGSVDLYLQNESPGKEKESNWLPAPKGRFIPMFRLYWPSETPPSILDGSWNPPPVKLVK
jgi:hypothetical protein